MDNLADISLDLICAMKFQPPGGYEIEDIAAIENACWQTLLHGLEPAEYNAVIAAADLGVHRHRTDVQCVFGEVEIDAQELGQREPVLPEGEPDPRSGADAHPVIPVHR